jgi:hypothetical protein
LRTGRNHFSVTALSRPTSKLKGFVTKVDTMQFSSRAPHTLRSRWAPATLALCSALALVACGDGDGEEAALGTTVGNVGLEGVSFDPLTGGYIFVKERSPLGIFQTTLNFTAGTASNGSATTENPTNLFDPALGSNAYLTFPAAVTAGTGNITLVGSGGDTRTIAVTDSTQVSFSGSTVKIKPSADLSPSTTYSIQYGSGVFRAASANGVSGLATQAVANAQALAFTSVPDTTAPTYASSTPPDNATGIAEGSNTGPGGGISPNSETIFAFQGSIASLTATTAGNLSVDSYLAAINLGTAGPLDTTLQTALASAGAFIAFTPEDNVRFAGSLDATDLAALRARIANTANWARDNTTPYPLTGGSLFP